MIAPSPSMFGGRDSSETTCACGSCSSAASSIVMMRSSSGMNDESTLSSVVLPEPVPPEMTMFARAFTAAPRNVAICSVSEPSPIRSLGPEQLLRELADRDAGPRSASGGMIALTREPSLRRASTIGTFSSMRRPSGATMRSMTPRSCSSLRKRASLSSRRPFRST